MLNRWRVVCAVTALSLLSAVSIYLAVGEIVRAGPGSAPAASPDVPALMNYQGRLTDPDTGLAVADGSYNMHFAIYDAPTGGTVLWQEPTAPAVLPVSVEDGLFTVLLGNIVPLAPEVFTGGTAYLELQVNGETLLPRQHITSVAFAMVAQEAENAAAIDGQTSADLNDAYVNSAGDTMTGTLIVPTFFAKNGSEVNTIDVSGATATIKIGTSENEGKLQIVDGGGVPVFDFDGSLASLRIGGTGNEGDLQIYNDDNELVIDLDAEEFAGNAGVRVFAQDGTQALSINGGTGDISQSLAGDGLVKAAVHVDREGTTLTVDRWFNNVNGVAPVLTGSAGNYTLDMGFDASTRFMVCTVDPSFENTRNANCVAGPSGEDINIRIWDPDDSFTPAEFNLLVY